MSAIYDVKPGETFWTASDIGWVVGHSYIVYGPLIHGCSSVLYEGKPVGTPDAGAFWRVIQDYKVKSFFTAPTAFRAVRKEDPDAKLVKKYDTSSLRALFLAGERADPDTVAWAGNILGVPVVDHWWQTETGWPIVANPVGLGMLPIKLGSPTVPMPGYESIRRRSGKAHADGDDGLDRHQAAAAARQLPTLYRQDERMRDSYLGEFPGYYKTADAGFIDEDGYLTILGRTDDIINVAGHRLSTGGMEEVLASHPDVAECAVLGVKDEIKGETPCGFLVLKAGVNRPPHEIESEVVRLVRDRIGPVAVFKMAIVVPRLPKTRSGKFLRGTMKKIADQDRGRRRRPSRTRRRLTRSARRWRPGCGSGRSSWAPNALSGPFADFGWTRRPIGQMRIQPTKESDRSSVTKSTACALRPKRPVVRVAVIRAPGLARDERSRHAFGLRHGEVSRQVFEHRRLPGIDLASLENDVVGRFGRFWRQPRRDNVESILEKPIEAELARGEHRVVSRTVGEDQLAPRQPRDFTRQDRVRL